MQVLLAPTLRTALIEATGPFDFGGDTYLVFDGEAEEVRLQTWMPRFPDFGAFTPLGHGQRWYLAMPLPDTARVEYRLLVKQADRWHEMDDPLNPAKASNPFGVNSVVTGPGYRPPSNISSAPTGELPAGDLSEIRVTSHVLSGRRHHHVLLPPGFRRGAPLPLLLIHDGGDFARFSGLVDLLATLVEDGRMAPLVTVLLDPRERLTEYGANPAHSRHVVEEVIPHLHRRLGLVSHPSNRALLGSSLGAVASLATAYHYPDDFARLGLLSGTFVHEPHRESPDAFHDVVSLMAAFASEPRLDGYRVYASVGRYEGLVDFHRRLAPQLRAAGMDLMTRETWDGHHWGAWRDRLAECLPFLFPGPAVASRVPSL